MCLHTVTTGCRKPPRPDKQSSGLFVRETFRAGCPQARARKRPSRGEGLHRRPSPCGDPSGGGTAQSRSPRCTGPVDPCTVIRFTAQGEMDDDAPRNGIHGSAKLHATEGSL